MCIAIYKPKDAKISVERLKEAYKANPDGCGLLYAMDNHLYAVKGCYDFATFHMKYRAIEDYPQDIIIHFRTATSGTISDENCHPFFVNRNLAFVENGNLFEFTNFFEDFPDDKTDVIRFNERLLKRLPDDFLCNSEIRLILEEYCHRNFTKMIFMDAAGKVNIINADAGEWIDGCWYSNGGIKNYIGYGYSGAYYYNATDIRHKGGRITNWLFPRARHDNWHKCEYCKGYFYKLDKMFCDDCGVFLKLRRFLS